MASSSQNIATNTRTPENSLVLFARGVIARLTMWSALRLAVDEAWGGPESAQKRTWMVSAIVDAFDPAESQETPDDYYVEDMLLQMMGDEFDVILEDGSAEVVAKDIMKLWNSISDVGGISVVDDWESQAQKMKGKKVASQQVVDDSAELDGEDGDSDEEESDMEVDEVPQLLDRREPKKHEEPEVDEDGFTLVRGKGRGNRAG